MFGRKDPAPEALERVELEAYVPELDFPAPLAEEAPPWPVSDTQPEAVEAEPSTDRVRNVVRAGLIIGAVSALGLNSVLLYDGTIGEPEYYAAGLTVIGTYMLAQTTFTAHWSRHPKTETKKD